MEKNVQRYIEEIVGSFNGIPLLNNFSLSLNHREKSSYVFDLEQNSNSQTTVQCVLSTDKKYSSLGYT